MTSENINILVVDDDSYVLNYLSTVLEKSNYSVTTLGNSEEAITSIREKKFTVVLADIRMPAVSGLELLERIHSVDPEIPVILMTAYADIDTAIDAVNKGAFNFITKPFNRAFLLRAIEKAVKHHELIETERNYKLMLEETVQKRTRELAETALMASRMSLEIIQRLSSVAEFRDSYTAAHISRIGLYSGKIAEALKMDREFIEGVTVASSLHDIGKIGIPDKILLKNSRLTEDEYDLMKEHTVIGGKILSDSSHPTIRIAHSIALSHHEKWQGGGYPNGLKNSEIPIEARIVKIADQYDALRSERTYKPSLSHQESIAIITKGDERTSPDDFDPAVLDAFMQIAPSFDQIFSLHQD